MTRIHSVAGVLPPGGGLVRVPPFRAPHHSASVAAIVGGGGGMPRPGEVSLAHHGVLFLDELPEFQRPALEALRQPLEDGVRLGRRASAGASSSRRASSSSATMNLCPCGARGDPARRSARARRERVQRYRDKLSRALLDRFDLLARRAAAARRRARGRARRARRRSFAIACSRACRRLRDDPPERTTGGRRAADAGSRAAAAFGPRPGARRACRSDDRCARRRRGGPA